MWTFKICSKDYTRLTIYDFSENKLRETTRRGYPEEKVYIRGGFTLVENIFSSKIDKIVGDRLEQKSNMQIKRAGHGVAVLNGNIYITGGFDVEWVDENF